MFSKLAHKLLMLQLWAWAIQPLWILYRYSSILAWILRYIVRYRLSAVRKNLRESFPEKSQDDLREIEHQFYRNFTDYIFETVKLLHISDRQMSQRMEFEGVEIMDELLGQGRSVVAYFSHCGNWEWAPSVTLHSRYASDPAVAYCQIYRPLKDRWFDALMLRLRSRFGSVSIPKRTALRHLVQYRHNNISTVTGFMSDQKPSHGDEHHIVMFLNHPTAIITGTEQLARRMDMAVIYWDMYKTRRGHYKIKMRLMTKSAAATAPGELTDRYASLLQQTICRNPAIWLWSHKRWKNPVTMPDDQHA